MSCNISITTARLNWQWVKNRFPKWVTLETWTKTCDPYPDGLILTHLQLSHLLKTLCIKMVDPEPCKELRRRISAAIYGWACPLLPFIYTGFDCGSVELSKDQIQISFFGLAWEYLGLLGHIEEFFFASLPSLAWSLN